MLQKCVLTILELNWNQRLGHKRTKLNICHHILTSSTQLQNRSFHVVERTRTSTKCQKMKNARAKCAKLLFFIVNYADLWGFCCRRRRGCLSSLLSEERRNLPSIRRIQHVLQICTAIVSDIFIACSGVRMVVSGEIIEPELPDPCLTGLQISTNQRATRKCIWGSIHSRAFREGKFTYSFKK